MFSWRRVGVVIASLGVLVDVQACGSSGDTATPIDAGPDGEDALDASRSDTSPPPVDAPVAVDAQDAATDARPPLVTTNIKHVVVIVQENHTFDTYFGRWCTAPAGSNPSCTTGRACCEAAPDKDPSGASPVLLDDTANATYDPNHSSSCELAEIHGGAMDRFVVNGGCSNPKNFAIATDAVKPYQDLAATYALADRYFQPLAGESTDNDLYFAVAKFVFSDNAFQPNSNGHGCTVPPTATTQYKGQTTLADLLLTAGKTFGFYAEGYKAMLATPLCPLAPADCPAKIPAPPCVYSPSDSPFQFYAQLTDNPLYMKDLSDFTAEAQKGTLPTLSFVKHVQYKNEHPGYATVLSQGVTAVTSLVSTILASPVGNDTLVLLTWDEGGGYYDHVAPPPNDPTDGKPYGTRVPLLALGRFARKGAVSHVVMEHSSIVKFVEWAYLGNQTGQLGGRDTTVNGIGSLLDPAEVGAVVP
jgi:phospholipase C